MASYCSVDDVASSFPQFKRNAPGSIQDSTIQGWIDDEAARINAAVMARGVDLSAALTPEASAFLKAVNSSCAIADLGVALEGTATMQTGEYSTAKHNCDACEQIIADILDGKYDKTLMPDKATTALVGVKVAGTAGAETDRQSTPALRGENRAFGKNQVF